MSFKGKLIMQETPADEITKEIVTIDNMINIVKNNLKSPNQSFIDKRMISSFEKSSVQAVNLSLELNIPIICDDSLLNDLLTNEVSGYKYSNTLCYIHQLLINGKITNYEYREVILKLVSMNYYFVPLTTDDLLHNIENIKFSDLSLNKRAIESLKDINLIQEGKLIIVSDFILKIYLYRKLTSFVRNNWVEFILTEITKNDSDATKTINEIYRKIENALIYLVKEKNFDKTVKTKILKWLSQLINTRNKK